MIKALRRCSLRLVLLVVLGGVTCLSAGSALALPPRDPIEPPPIDETGEDFTPPENGFDWSAESRFGLDRDGDRIIDYHWRDHTWSNGAERNTYDPGFIHSGFRVHFDGCPTEEERAAADARPLRQTENTYEWELPGRTSVQRNCKLTHQFPAEGTYSVTLTVIGPGEAGEIGGPYTQDVTVKDFLIVSIGDSYASGEGNPDVFQQVRYGLFGVPFTEQPAKWVDKRCHRSAYAGAAQAAMALEAGDPKTSVTFLSFACSGATIDTPYWADGDMLDPYVPGNPEKPLGTGVLGFYRGAEPPNPETYSLLNTVPPQIKQVADAVGDRQIDALFMSGGGNDIGFVPISTVCVLFKDCKHHQVHLNRDANGNPVKVSLMHRASNDIAELGGKYDRLAACLRPTATPCVVQMRDNPANYLELQPLNPANVYVTEYPEQFRSSTGGICDRMLDDIIPMPIAVAGALIAPPIMANMLGPWAGPLAPLAQIAGLGLTAYIFINHIPFELGGEEVTWAANTVLPGLNGTVAAAAARHDWQLLRFGNEFGTHGYCASDNWIRTAEESQVIQGPFGIPRSGTTGTLHPSIQGQRAYGALMLAELRQDLYQSSTTPDPAPEFDTNDAIGSTSSNVGANGWFTGRCPAGQPCLSDHAVLTVEAADANGIRGVGVFVNGAEGCSAQASCNPETEVVEEKITRYRWPFQINADGVYRLDFTAGGRDGQVATFAREVKVDLHDPTGVSATLSSSPGDSGWYREPVEVTLNGIDAIGGSGIESIQFHLNGGPALSTPPNTTLEVADNGVHTIVFRAIDFAGRMSPQETLTLRIDTSAPTVDCAGADGTWHANDVSLACAASDGGSGIVGEAAFSLGTSVPAGSETSSAETGSRQLCDVAGNCTMAGPIGGNQVDRKAPNVVVPADVVVNATSLAGGVATFAASATDGADADPDVRCTPGSGSTFPVGLTTVACEATDHVGNASQGSFTVTVKAPREQIVDLIDKTLDFMSLPPLEAALRTQLEASAAALATRPAIACALLGVYIVAVKAAPAKAGLTSAEKAVLVADATRIKAALGCR